MDISNYITVNYNFVCDPALEFNINAFEHQSFTIIDKLFTYGQQS